MLDAMARRVIDPPLNYKAPQVPCSALQVTLIGFALGVVCIALVAVQEFTLALLFLWLNRICDGLDGAVARARNESSDLGAFLDISSDFILWAALPLAFIWCMPETAWSGAVLLSSFAMSMTVFLAFATMAEKRQLTTEVQGKKSFFYLSGLAEGTETILFFSACLIWPAQFATLALLFSGLVFLSVLGRLVTSWQILSDTSSE